MGVTDSESARHYCHCCHTSTSVTREITQLVSAIEGTLEDDESLTASAHHCLLHSIRLPSASPLPDYSFHTTSELTSIVVSFHLSRSLSHLASTPPTQQLTSSNYEDHHDGILFDRSLPGSRHREPTSLSPTGVSPNEKRSLQARCDCINIFS
jgi:hypothetical protein